MSRWIKITAAAGFTALFVLAAGVPAGGAESSVIEKLTVTFTSSYGEPGEIPDPDITVSESGCALGDVQYGTVYEKWKPGRKVRVEVTVNAAAGKYFPISLNRAQCRVTGADFVSARALDDTTIQVKADYRPITVLNASEKAGWHSNIKKRALWKSVAYAPGYALTLYGDNKVVRRMTVESNYADLAEDMKDMDKTYYYEVKAVPLTSDQKKYLREGAVVSSTDQVFDWEDYEEEAVKTRDTGDGGAPKGDSYIMPDGSKAVNTWKQMSGKWYYFDSAGNRTRGWLSYGGTWYYLNQSGEMCTGWVEAGGLWYCLGQYGDMLTGWIQPAPGDWYFLTPSGEMAQGWVRTGGQWYYLEPDGRMKTGWLDDHGTWYYLGNDGSMAVSTSVEGWRIGPDGVAPR